MAVSFDRIADRYDATRGGAIRGRVLAEAIHPWLRPTNVPAHPLVLEICVGTGVVAAGLASFGFAVCGVDISSRMAAIARERLGARVAIGDAGRLPIASSSVDAVVFAAALHLVGDIDTVLGEAARVLRPGGRLVAIHATPQAESTASATPPDVVAAQAPLDDVRLTRSDTAEHIDAGAARARLSLLHRGLTGPTAVSRSPREIADNIDARVWSFLWPLDDEQWQCYAIPAIEALRSLPDQDRRRDYARRHHIAVYAASHHGAGLPVE